MVTDGYQLTKLNDVWLKSEHRKWNATGSDHYAVVVKIMLRDKWEFCRKIGKEKRSKVLAKERLGKEAVCEERLGITLVVYSLENMDFIHMFHQNL